MSRNSWLALIAFPLVVLAGVIALVVLILPASAACNTEDASTASIDNLPTEPVAGYSAPQLELAAVIMNEARALSLPRSAQLLALMAAMTESNLDADAKTSHGRGLYALPDSPKWGTLADRLDPSVSTANFYKALNAVTLWQDLEPTIAIHRTLGTADPFAYEAAQGKAEAVFAALAASNGTCLSGALAYPLEAGYNMTDDFGPRRAPLPGLGNWHAAVDLQNYPNPCNDPIYAITDGTVTMAGGYQVSIKHADGYTVSYLHMYPSSMLVGVGDPVATGEEIAATGDNGPATGCHVDVRVNVIGSTVPELNELTRSESLGAPTAGFVDPEDFYRLFGMELCPEETCSRNYR